MTEAIKFQNGSLVRAKNKRTPDTWFFRYREDDGARRVYRNLKIGTVRELPHRRDAEKKVLSLRVRINSGMRSPETVEALIAHYTKHELTLDRKAFSTINVQSSHLKLHIAPTWGSFRLSAVRTMAVEAWISGLPLAPTTRSSIRNIMSALFSHAIRHEWLSFNPITKVRTSAARLRDPDVLTPEEFRLLLGGLDTRERAMVMLAGSTGMRRSEMFALQWSDICMSTMQVSITKSVVRNRLGTTKTVASRKPVPLHVSVAQALEEWRNVSPYSGAEDFLFPSTRADGTRPLFPDMILKRHIRPAAQRAGIGKTIGWHTFRHSLATNLRTLGVDVKVAQELLRHANSRITMDLYTHAVSADKRDANTRATALLIGQGPEALHRCAPLASPTAPGRSVSISS